MFNWGFIGSGTICRNTSKQMLKSGKHKIVGVYSRTFSKAKAFADKVGATAYETLDELLNDKNIQGIYVGTPHSSHFKYAKAALEKGIPVLCEKSFTLSYESSLKLIEIAKEHNTYICEAIADPEIRVIVREAMTESAIALSKRYNKPLDEIIAHTDDLIRRFGNTALGDTCERVGADIPRKLAKSDRLTGGALSVIEAGDHPTYIAIGAAAALVKYYRENPLTTPETFTSLTGVEDGEYKKAVLDFAARISTGDSLSNLITYADSRLAAMSGTIM